MPSPVNPQSSTGVIEDPPENSLIATDPAWQLACSHHMPTLDLPYNDHGPTLYPPDITTLNPPYAYPRTALNLPYVHLGTTLNLSYISTLERR